MLAINSDAVTIKQVEIEIVDRAWDEGWVTPAACRSTAPARRSPWSAPGPAGLAAAQQLTRVGHDVVVFERADRIGGLLRYGIPEFKMEKQRLDRRLEQMQAEGTLFRASASTSAPTSPPSSCARTSTPSCSPAGPPRGATCPPPGRELEGVYQAMEFLPWANHVQQGDIDAPPITAEGKHVVIIGGGDTGADCLGTSHRQGAAVGHPAGDHADAPGEAHRGHAVADLPDGLPGVLRARGGRRPAVLGEHHRVRRRRRRQAAGHAASSRSPATGTAASSRSRAPSRSCPRQLVLLAMGFVGPEKGKLLSDLGVELDERGNVARDGEFMTSVDGVFAAGDMGRGQSLIVWAIAEGRAAAAGVDAYLTGRDVLPEPDRAHRPPARLAPPRVARARCRHRGRSGGNEPARCSVDGMGVEHDHVSFR